MRVLIVGDANLRGSLASVRGLARAGWTVGIGSPRPGHASASRFCSRWHSVPLVGRSLEEFVRAINRAAADGGYELAFGGGDAEVLALSAARRHLHLSVPYAEHESVCNAMDKLGLYGAARRSGLMTPRTVVATEQAIAQVTGKVVVKPRMHWSPQRWLSPLRLEAAVVGTVDEAARQVRRIHAAGGTALLQEFVDGQLMAYVALTSKRADVVAGFMQTASAVWPMDGGGIFARANTTAPGEQLTTKVSQLLAHLGWFGITQLQFIQPRCGDPCLIDFNGRYYMSLSLPVEAGLNLPAMWAALATDTHVPTNTMTLPEGLRYQWLELDLRRALVERRGGALNDILDTLRYGRHAIHTMGRKDDPRPAVDYLLRLCGRVIHAHRLHAPLLGRPRRPSTRPQ
jgi:predicted ATP-grasp superfamily ATP-dependent carboligase